MENNIQTSDYSCPDNPEIMVSVLCITYNHAKFIREALDGFVMQRTNFPFEVIIHDDCSTDGTDEIVREYAAKYPHLLRPLYETENQYSKKLGSITMRFCLPLARGKYIAFCEGDDYWTDPLKLQKQVDFLESHPDYSMCFHNALSRWEDHTQEDSRFSMIKDGDYTGPDIYKHWIVPTASVVLKKSVYDSDIYHKATLNKNFCFGDIVLFLSAAHCGKLRGLEDCMSVYRRHEGSAVYNLKKNIDLRMRSIRHNKEIPKVFGTAYKEYSRTEVARQYLELSIDLFKQKKIIVSLKLLFKAFFSYPTFIFAKTLKLFTAYFKIHKY